jgi:NADP-dependent aldehyde dehydrogenase
MQVHPVLIAGQWRESAAQGTFQAEDPAEQRTIDDLYPMSSWADADAALAAAAAAADEMRLLEPARIAAFLEAYAARIEARKSELVEMANRETALPKSPRLADNELPRTSNQLRLAAAAAREGSWALPTIDTNLDIRSLHAAIGPVCIFGPNNFPLAFNAISGGDFAAAVAAGNPVIALGHPCHPNTTRLLAEEASAAACQTGMPAAAVQLLYRLSYADGERLVADPRIAAVAYTGGRASGLKLKTCADRVGKPIYLELSSINPVVILPGALAERSAKIADEFTTSCLSGTGQFCTNPGFLLLLRGPLTDAFITAVVERFRSAPVGTLLSRGVCESLARGVASLRSAGAELLVGDADGGGQGYSRSNTLLRATGDAFLRSPADMQSEAFGNASLIVVADDIAQAARVLRHFEGNLTGTIYSESRGGEETEYAAIAAQLRPRVGRLLDDKMPTGVAVSTAMNHGGPYPATGHPGFTSVGIPASLRRFSMLQCFDNVRQSRLPAALRDRNPGGGTWRLVDGQWTTGDVKPRNS